MAARENSVCVCVGVCECVCMCVCGVMCVFVCVDSGGTYNTYWSQHMYIRTFTKWII